MMNIGKSIFFAGAVASVFMLNSCGDSSDEAQVQKEGEKKVNVDLLDPDRSFNTTFDGKLFSVPSPVQTALLIKSLNIPFNEALLNEKDNAKKYSTSTADRKSTRLNSSHVRISYAVFCLKKKRQKM